MFEVICFVFDVFDFLSYFVIGFLIGVCVFEIVVIGEVIDFFFSSVDGFVVFVVDFII